MVSRPHRVDGLPFARRPRRPGLRPRAEGIPCFARWRARGDEVFHLTVRADKESVILEEMKRPKTIADPKKVMRLRRYLSLGFKDYIGARTLLIEGLPLQGSILASTAVEKYFKAVQALRGNTTNKHLNRALINAMANYDQDLMDSLNATFLTFLTRCYSLRYDEALRPGFNLSIAAPHVLAELDVTVSAVQGRILLLYEDGTSSPTPTRYDSALAARSQYLFKQNCVLHGIDKRAFVAATKMPAIYEMRILEDGTMLEAEYLAKKVSENDNFLIEGLRPAPRENPKAANGATAPAASVATGRPSRPMRD